MLLNYASIIPRGWAGQVREQRKHFRVVVVVVVAAVVAAAVVVAAVV